MNSGLTEALMKEEATEKDEQQLVGVYCATLNSVAHLHFYKPT